MPSLVARPVRSRLGCRRYLREPRRWTIVQGMACSICDRRRSYRVPIRWGAACRAGVPELLLELARERPRMRHVAKLQRRLPPTTESGNQGKGSIAQDRSYALRATFGRRSTMSARRTAVPSTGTALSHVVPTRHIQRAIIDGLMDRRCRPASKSVRPEGIQAP
jgi:hypothetical protein